jgi:acetaldehyde dehydrogenase (acetylating)
MKVKVAILGTGNIGTDLLLKFLKKNFIKVVAFVGRRLDSDTVKIAKEMGIFVSDKGISYFTDNPNLCDVVFDCTNAADAFEHAKVFAKQGIKVIDLTPSRVGEMCVPDVNGHLILNAQNINMITCGGQATMPILNILSKRCKLIDYIEIVSQISSNSAGMATRINIDEYIKTTQKAITKFTGCSNNKVILNLNPAEPCVDMQTTVFMKSNEMNVENLTEEIVDKIEELRKYIPHYELVLSPSTNEQGIVCLSIRVRGSGDYLPEYAGNLDIINCAAIREIEILWKNINENHNN